MIKWIALGIIAAFVLLFIFAPTVAWIILGLILLILIVVLFVPIGADIGYVDGVFSLAARIDGLAIQLLPKKPEDPNKPKKKKKEKKPEEPKEEQPKQEEKEEKKGSGLKLNFTADEILELLKKVFNGLGKFGKLTVRRFMLHYVAAWEDPYNAAMIYNYVNAALSTLAPICARNFRITGDVDVWTDVDFTTDKMKIDFALSVTLRLAQLVYAGLAAGVGALSVLIKNRRRLKREAREAKKQQPTEPVEGTEIEVQIQKDSEIQNTIKAEERKETHG